MATIVAAAGGGNWDASTTSTWVGGVIPTAADDVQLKSTSGNVTINANVVCRSLDCTGYTGTLNHTGAFSISIGDGTAGLSNIALKIVSGMTYTIFSNTSAINFISTSSTVQTVDYAAKTVGPQTFNGTGGKWQLQSNFTVNALTSVTLTAGTLDVNGKSISCGVFSTTGTGVRTLTLGAATITTTLTTGGVTAGATPSNLTITANTASFLLNGPSSNFSLGNLNWNGVSVTYAGGGNMTIAPGGSSATVANLTVTGTAAKTDNLSFSNPLTVTSAVAFNGNSATNRLLIKSNTRGTSRTITIGGSGTLKTGSSNVDFMDITATGGAANELNLSAITGLSGDCGGNSGMTFTTPATQTATGTSSFTWSTHGWTSRVPLPQDNVSIPNAFSASQTVTMDMPRLGSNLSFTCTGSPAAALSANAEYYGSLTLATGQTATGAFNLTAAGRSTHTLQTRAISMAWAFIQDNGGTGSYTLSAAMVTTAGFTITSGTFDSASFNITATTFTLSGTATRSITLGTSTLASTTTAATTVLAMSFTGATYSCTSATLTVATSSNAKTISIGGNAFGTITYNNSGSTGSLIFANSAFLTGLNFSDATNARTMTLPSGTGLVISAGGFNVDGTSGKLMTINSSTPGSASSISIASGFVVADYLSLTDSNATGGATFFAGSNSTDGGGNTGWNFTAPIYGGFFNFF